LTPTSITWPAFIVWPSRPGTEGEVVIDVPFSEEITRQ